MNGNYRCLHSGKIHAQSDGRLGRRDHWEAATNSAEQNILDPNATHGRLRSDHASTSKKPTRLSNNL
jgi:hypothetical protein